MEELQVDVRSGNLSLACDWPGSTNTQDSDKISWEQLNCKLDVYKDEAQKAVERKEAFRNATDILKAIRWWGLYSGGIKIGLRTTVQKFPSEQVKAICINGGPISQIEAHEMQGLIEDTTLDLEKLGQKSRIQLRTFQDVDELREEMRRSALSLLR